MTAWRLEPMDIRAKCWGFSPEMLCQPLLQLPSVAACLLVFLPSVLSSVTENHVQFGWGQGLTWQLKKIPSLCLEKLLGCWRRMFWVIMCLCCEALSTVVQDLAESEQIVKSFTLQNSFLLLISAVTLSTPVTKFHWQPYMPMPWHWLHYVWQMMWRLWIMSHSSPSPHSSLAISLV